jgi:hypothetical protein
MDELQNRPFVSKNENGSDKAALEEELQKVYEHINY